MNVLTKTIPKTIQNLISLTRLSLYFNELSSSIPHFLGNLTKLTALRLSDNEFTNSFPKALCDLTNLILKFHFLNQRQFYDKTLYYQTQKRPNTEPQGVPEALETLIR